MQLQKYENNMLWQFCCTTLEHANQGIRSMQFLDCKPFKATESNLIYEVISAACFIAIRVHQHKRLNVQYRQHFKGRVACCIPKIKEAVKAQEQINYICTL